jgi:hypothetical protein
MAPQPLSSVAPDAQMWAAKLLFCKDPDIWAQCGRIICAASDIEILFGEALHIMAGIKTSGPAMAMYGAVNQTAKMAAVGAVADSVLSGVDLDLFQIVQRLATVAMRDRHVVAHWVWAQVYEMPDALLFIEPDAVHAAHLEGFQMTHGSIKDEKGRPMPTPQTRIFPSKGSSKIDPARVLVYRKQDLVAAAERLELVGEYVSLMRIYMPPHRESGPMQQHLLAWPEIETAYKALCQRRRTNPEARPRRRRRGRSER